MRAGKGERWGGGGERGRQTETGLLELVCGVCVPNQQIRLAEDKFETDRRREKGKNETTPSPKRNEQRKKMKAKKEDKNKKMIMIMTTIMTKKNRTTTMRRRRRRTVKPRTRRMRKRQQEIYTPLLAHPQRQPVGSIRPPRWPSGKASASRAKIPGSNPACDGIFWGSSHTSDSKIGTPVATLPGAWCYRVSTGTGRPGVSTL